jgi:hypothetical protein
VKVASSWPGATLIPPVSVRLDLEAQITGKPVAPLRSPGKGRPPGQKAIVDPQASWWTARATTGEVKAGFSKDEVLRKPEQDPRAEGGVFARLGALLDAFERR